MRGVESTPELPGYNLYANGVSIICLDQGFQKGDGWVSEDGTCIVKIMQTGYLPMDPDDEAAYAIANDLHDFLDILQTCGHRNLPDYAEMCIRDRCIHRIFITKHPHVAFFTINNRIRLCFKCFLILSLHR